MSKTSATALANIVRDFLKAKGQLALLPEVIAELNRYAIRAGLKDSAIITSATPLSDADRRAITKFVADKYGSGYHLVERVDPSLIAGFTIKIDDQVIDTALSSKLDAMRKELV